MTAHDTVALAPVDPVIQEIQQQIKAAGCSQADPTTLSIAEAREQQSRYFGFVNRNLPPIGRTQDLSIQTRGGAISARLYRPEDARTDFFAVFARGAGWWAGDLDSHEGACREVAQALGRCVVALDYRRSPEHVFPAQLDDVTDAAAWLIQHARQLELHSQRVVLWGESAGATLMSLACRRLQEAGLGDHVLALVLFYGNLGGPRPNLRKQSQWVWQQYLGAAYENPPPAAIPMQVDLASFPPVWLGAGDADPLIEDSKAFARRLGDAGLRHRLEVYPGLPHAFSAFTQHSPAARAALDDAVAFVLGCAADLTVK